MCFAITFVKFDGFWTNLADCFLNKFLIKQFWECLDCWSRQQPERLIADADVAVSVDWAHCWAVSTLRRGYPPTSWWFSDVYVRVVRRNGYPSLSPGIPSCPECQEQWDEGLLAMVTVEPVSRRLRHSTPEMHKKSFVPRCLFKYMYFLCFFNVHFYHCTACTVYFHCVHVRVLRVTLNLNINQLIKSTTGFPMSLRWNDMNEIKLHWF